MISPLRRLGGVSKHMATMIDQDWHGYRVTARPTSLLRRLFSYRRWYLPFMDGDGIYLTLTIKSPRMVTRIGDVQCLWVFKDFSSGREFGSGAIPVAKHRQATRIASDPIMTPSKYILECQLVEKGVKKDAPSLVASLPVKERGDATFSFAVPTAIAVVALLLSLVAIVISIVLH
jgi:hypothetical protein